MKMFIVSAIVAIFLLPLTTKADLIPNGVAFGGFVTSFVPCTCPPFGVVIYYTPFFTGIPVPAVGGLYYRPKSAMLYAHFAPYGPVVPGTLATWNLGMYEPGISECRLPDPAQLATPDVDPCDPGIPVPALGQILFMGTSLPSLGIF